MVNIEGNPLILIQVSDTPDVPMTLQVDTNQPETRVNLVVDTETQNLIPSHFEGFVIYGVIVLQLKRLFNLECSILFLLQVYQVMVRH